MLLNQHNYSNKSLNLTLALCKHFHGPLSSAFYIAMDGSLLVVKWKLHLTTCLSTFGRFHLLLCAFHNWTRLEQSWSVSLLNCSPCATALLPGPPHPQDSNWGWRMLGTDGVSSKFSGLIQNITACFVNCPTLNYFFCLMEIGEKTQKDKLVVWWQPGFSPLLQTAWDLSLLSCTIFRFFF